RRRHTRSKRDWSSDGALPIYILNDIGVGERMMKEGALHDGIELQLHGERFRINIKELTGSQIMLYAQHEVVIDLLRAENDSREKIGRASCRERVAIAVGTGTE